MESWRGHGANLQGLVSEARKFVELQMLSAAPDEEKCMLIAHLIDNLS